MNQKESQRDQIHNLQKQIAAMEREIEHLYAERKKSGNGKRIFADEPVRFYRGTADEHGGISL